MNAPGAGNAAADTPGEIDRRGHEIASRLDFEAISRLLARAPAARLLADLAAIVEVIDASDAQRTRRRAGLLGRLLGWDLVAQAHPDAADARLRVHLAHASEHAERVQRHLSDLAALPVPVEQQIAAMDAFVTSSREACAASGASAHRRLDYFQALGDSWRTTRAQLELEAAHIRRVLERYHQVRDLLVPLWHQQAAGAAINKRSNAGTPRGTEHDEHALRRLIASLQASAPAPTPHTPQHPTPADREPSP
ncbi:hypothetical protein [Lysobacter sp. A3-1-A15]|uniref:hypothetical protein n=1 Tax=Novilysobacter viscosus TaxID=3098602 RepID=UPI002EDA175C